MQKRISITEEEGRTLRARLALEIDHHSAVEIRSRIDSALFNIRPEILILDFSGVRFMDSSGIGLILGRAEKARSLGTRIQLFGMSKTLIKLARLSGIDRIDNVEMI